METFVTFILLLSTPTVDTTVAAYADRTDCESVAYVLNLHLTSATAYCVEGVQE